MKKINKKNGSVGVSPTQELTKEVHTVPQGIKITINDKKPQTSQKKLLGPPVPTGVRTDACESRV